MGGTLADARPWLATLLVSLTVVLIAGAGPVVGDSTTTLYGHALRGWGTSADTITNPGPALELTRGQAHAFTFFSADGTRHAFFVDLNGDGVQDPGEPTGPDFEAATGTPGTITVDQTGTFTYRCRYHPTTMTGSVMVRPPAAGSGPSNGGGGQIVPGLDNTLLILIIVALVLIVVVVAFANAPRGPPPP